MRERGAVSIFIVIFTALLVTVVTTSFIQIMLRNQRQATDNDLSQSAYDSAMAGVEDTKRALVRLKKCQQSFQDGCTALINEFSSADANGWTDCEVLGDVGAANFVDGEVVVGGDAEAYDQAYNCVKVKVKTEAYNGKLLPDQGALIPLVPVIDGVRVKSPNDIQSVRISWFSKAKEDVADIVTSAQLPSDMRLVRSNADWGTRTPPMMRAQLMQFNKGTITLDEFDGESSRTRLLYPFAAGGNDSFENDTRTRTDVNSPTPGGCVTNFSLLGEYSCSVIVTLPPMSEDQTREAYLYLSGIYVQTQGFHYSVEMLDATGPSGVIYFDNVQPQVDSTGRAGDLYRRVRASVDVSEAGLPIPYPTAAVSTGNLCKEFFITSNVENYDPDYNGVDGACTP